MFKVMPDEPTPAVDVVWTKEDIEENKNWLYQLAVFGERYKRIKLAGLAANQLSIDGERWMAPACWIRDPKDESLGFVAVNPELVSVSGEPKTCYEGCATWRDKVIKAQRYPDIQVKYMAIDGEEHTTDYSGFLAQVWQHEIDHLVGANEMVMTHREAKIDQGRVPVKSEPKVGRNDPCKCGSGRKYKKCCLVKQSAPKVAAPALKSPIDKVNEAAKSRDLHDARRN